MRTRGDILIDEPTLATNRSADIVLDMLQRLAIQADYTNISAPVKTFDSIDVDVINDKITILAHGYPTGVKGQFSTTGTLPGGLSASTDYWLIKLDDDTIRVAQSLNDAESGTYIFLNSTGAGTQTFTPSAFGGEIKLGGSNDGTNFVDIPTTVVSVTGSGTSLFNVVEPAYRHLRFYYLSNGGVVELKVTLNGYDDIHFVG